MDPGRYATRALGMQLLAAAVFVCCLLALPHPSGAE